MASNNPNDLPLENRWLLSPRPAKRPLSGFIPIGPSTFSFVPPPGTLTDAYVSSTVIQRLYKDTPISAIIPPVSTAPPVAAPIVTITSFSFAGVQGSTSAKPTWNWVYEGGPADSYAWIVYGDASTTPTTVIASGTTPITSYVYTGATVANYYYKITVSATNATATATASETQRNVLAAPTVTLTSFSFAGVPGSTSAQPTWNWTYGGGAADSYVWTVYGDASATPTTVIATGTTPITSYAYTGATVANYYYKITVSATNATTTTSISDTKSNAAITAPTVIITSSSFAGVQGSTSAQPTWNWAYGGGPGASYAWTVFGDASTTPTTIVASGTTPITTYAFTGPTVANYYYKMTVSVTNAIATSSASDILSNQLAAPSVTLTSFSFAGVRGSTSAQPTWNWVYGGGPASVLTWTVYGDASATPTTVLVSGTTPITSYVYTGVTVANYYYKITISVANATSTASATDTQSNTLAAPTVTLTSSSFAGVPGSTSAQPTWNWTYGGGPADSYAWTVYGGASTTPTTIIASGTSPITSYAYTGATVANYYYKITVSITNATTTASISDTKSNAATTAPTVTVTGSSFAGVQGSTSAQPTWNWAYGGGPRASYAWTVFGDASATPTTVIASGTTAITSYTYTGATTGNYYYKITVSATNAVATVSASDTLRNTLALPVATLTSSGFTGTMGSTNAQPFWNWTFTGGAPTSQTWTVKAGTNNVPTAVIASGTTLINSYTFTGATVRDNYYSMTVTVSNALGTGTGFVNINNNTGSGTIGYVSQTIGQGRIANPTITVVVSSIYATRIQFRTYESVGTTNPTTTPPSADWVPRPFENRSNAAGTRNVTYSFNGTTVVNKYYRFVVLLQGSTSPFLTYGTTQSPSSMLCSPVPTPVATGGIITDANGYRTHKFISSGTFTLTSPASLATDILVIGGGGGGGFDNCAGGGGAGSINGALPDTISAGAYPVVVGLGGNGGSISGPATNGGDSTFFTYEATGGGCGGSIRTPFNGADGGCGGGGCYGVGLKGTGLATDGGDGSILDTEPDSGGGGGGNGGDGGRANPGINGGGPGGDGVDFPHAGTTYLVGGGGGGGTNGVSGPGGSSIGGSGGSPSTPLGAGGNGVANTGSGGGGGGGGFAATSGGNGGSGLVLISYVYP